LRQITRVASLLILMCSALVVSALTAGRIHPHAPQIAFVSSFNNSSSIYLLDIRHGALRPLTQIRGIQRGPVWSNDGRRLVYESNALNNNVNLFMINVRGGPSAERQLTYFSFDEVAALFMPNSEQALERLAFTTVRGPNGDIFMLNVPPVGENNRPELLTDSPFAEYAPTWSPDGKVIAYVSARENNTDLFMLDLTTNQETRLTDHPQLDSSPTWSPDGRYIAFHSRRNDNYELYVLDMMLTPPTLHQLTDHPAEDRDAVWSPDSRYIAFISQRDGNSNIYVLAIGALATLPSAYRLTDDPGTDREPAWALDSTQIAFISYRSGDADLYIAPLPKGDKTPRARRLTFSRGQDSSPAWRP